MPSGLTLEILLALLLLLQIKHLVADFVLQNAFILDNRWRYGHPGGLLHAGIHVAGSALAFAAVGGAPAVIAAILLTEGVLHYHIDWAKDNYTRSSALTPRDGAFWRAIGIDQCLHQLTYLVMVWAWVRAWAGTAV